MAANTGPIERLGPAEPQVSECIEVSRRSFYEDSMRAPSYAVAARATSDCIGECQPRG